jgi:hypothetical protein
MPLFVDPYALIFSNSSNDATPFLQAVKQYLCLALSRNAISSVPQVFDISVEIFWRILTGLRTKLKVCQVFSYIIGMLSFLFILLERDRGLVCRDLYSDHGHAAGDCEAKIDHIDNVCKALPRPAGSCGHLSELRLRSRGIGEYLRTVRHLIIPYSAVSDEFLPASSTQSRKRPRPRFPCYQGERIRLVLLFLLVIPDHPLCRRRSAQPR